MVLRFCCTALELWYLFESKAGPWTQSPIWNDWYLWYIQTKIVFVDLALAAYEMYMSSIAFMTTGSVKLFSVQREYNPHEMCALQHLLTTTKFSWSVMLTTELSLWSVDMELQMALARLL